MKVNLLLNDANGVLPGYLNLDPFAPDGDPARRRADPYDLSHSVDGGEATEIRAGRLLDYVSYRKADEVLDHWLSRLARNGTLSFSVLDLVSVGRALAAGDLKPDDANQLVYGEQEVEWDFCRGGYSIVLLTELFINRGYRVLQARSLDFRAHFTVQRV